MLPTSYDDYFRYTQLIYRFRILQLFSRCAGAHFMTAFTGGEHGKAPEKAGVVAVGGRQLHSSLRKCIHQVESS